MKINRGKYYYDFLRTVEKLRQEDDSCFICGATKKVKPHHIHRVKDSDKRYADKNNVVLLCGKHHHMFHQLYGSGKGVNGKNFAIFCKKEFEKEINKLRVLVYGNFPEGPVGRCRCIPTIIKDEE